LVRRQKGFTQRGCLQFFVIFILVIVPFVMLICFGLALINYDAAAIRSGWSLALPIKSPLAPPIVGATIFYIGRSLWLGWDWRKEHAKARRIAANI
jgi:hypothetical protein